MTHRRAIKEETIAINRDWVFNQAYKLSQDIKFERVIFATLQCVLKILTNHIRLFIQDHFDLGLSYQPRPIILSISDKYATSQSYAVCFQIFACISNDRC